VNDNGEYKEPLTAPLPGGTEQTEKILARGRLEHGLRFVVQHNGLGPRPQDRLPPKAPCPNEGKHPAVPPFEFAGSGCPNRYVLLEGVAGQVTAFQTNNAKGVANPVELESTLRNAWDNSDAIFLEIYEERLWEAETAGPVLDPNATGRTIGEWAEAFHKRRRDFGGAKIPDPFPMTHRHVFKRTISSETDNQLLYYVNSAKCGSGGANYGVIVIQPDNVVSVDEKQTNGPQEFALQQNYPNPFNPSTAISFQLPVNSHVTLKVFDVPGREVATLVDGNLAAGNHVVTFAPRQATSGLYFYKITVGKFSQFRKATLLK
jgi:hypothetical protein